MAAPARRALEREGITTLEKLSNLSEKEIVALHGMGKSTLPILKKTLEAEGLRFREET
jgi:DNA-directed RNA polymerase alpha subunit